MFTNFGIPSENVVITFHLILLNVKSLLINESLILHISGKDMLNQMKWQNER